MIFLVTIFINDGPLTPLLIKLRDLKKLANWIEEYAWNLATV